MRPKCSDSDPIYLDTADANGVLPLMGPVGKLVLEFHFNCLSDVALMKKAQAFTT